MYYREQEIKRLFADKRVLIAGMGREGQSAKLLLARLNADVLIDTADNNEGIREALTKTSYDKVIKSPGVPMRVLADLCTEEQITSMTDVFLQVYGDKTIGITGTKGKSTTTSLVYHILKESGKRVLLGGNIGIPLFELIENIDDATTIVAELSCHQLECIHRAPHIAVLLNLYQEHLDHYESYDGYKLAKMQIALKQIDNDIFIYCRDNTELAQMVETHKSTILSHIEPYSATDTPVYGTVRTKLIGAHNLSNIEAAAHVARACGVVENQFQQSVAQFSGLEHRLERVGTYRGITFYNDSISTIPAACESAIESIGNVSTVILGGFDRGINYAELMSYIVASNVRNIVFVGEAGKRMNTLLGESALSKNILIENDYEKIVDWCYNNTPRNTSCLLSPAAASYDQFKNFEERGRRFKQLVRCHLRHDLHAHPGLSGNESYAHDLIVETLEAIGGFNIYQHVGGFGVIAVWESGKNLPTVAFRADIDALPIDEMNALPYRSTIKGVAHKCGHDGHTTIMLRFAELLAATPSLRSSTNVMLIFQPEEETGYGSQKILDSGIMQQYDIEAIFGIHNIPGYAKGSLLISDNTFAAASVGVKYIIRGRQTHASTPEKGINPGRAVAELIEQFEKLNTGSDADISNFAQSTLICVNLGEEAYGTSAGDAEIMFTLRAFTNQRMQQLRNDADSLTSSVCEKYGLKLSTSVSDPFNATENDGELANRICRQLENQGVNIFRMTKPFRWSEDFANYLLQYKGMLFGIGAGEDCCELHHPEYDFPDDIIDPSAENLLKICNLYNNDNDTQTI